MPPGLRDPSLIAEVKLPEFGSILTVVVPLCVFRVALPIVSKAARAIAGDSPAQSSQLAELAP